MKSSMFRLLFAFMLAMPVPAMAAPGLINYQGRLTDPSGQPIITPFDIAFTFWSAAAGGAQLGSGFSDSDTVTADASGIYATLIGDDPGNLVPTSIFNGDSVWLNVRINGEDLTPRKRIVSVGYALRSDNADKLGGQPASSFMTAASDNWVNTAGDTMTGALTVTGSLSSAMADVTNSYAGSVAAIQGAATGAGNFINYGGYFEAAGGSGQGVYGAASGAAGCGVYGRATGTGTGAVGVVGEALSPSGATYGVKGWVNSPDGYAGHFFGRGYFSDNVGIGKTNPVSRLHVEGSGADALLVTNTGAGRGATINAANDTALWVNTTTGVAALDARNANPSGRGVNGSASGATGVGVLGTATATGAATNYGGSFSAAGNTGRGVLGTATATGAVTNYGGSFSAAGNTGRGVQGIASATGAVTNYGGYFQAAGSNGKGVFGEAPYTGSSTTYGGYFTTESVFGQGVEGIASGASGTGVRGEAIATGAVTNFGAYFSANGDSGRGVLGEATATGAVTNFGAYFSANGASGRGVLGSGKGYDFYAAGTGTNYGPFTGAHEVQFDAGFPANPKSGLIVVTSGSSKVRRDEAGQVSISSTLPSVCLADRPNAKAVFGVLVKEMPLPEDHWYKPAAGERFGAVNALGEGRVWVCSAAGPIEMGDYITTSAVPGYGQRQGDDLQHTYTVGKVIETVDWDAVTETIEHDGQSYKVCLIAVVYTCG